MSLPFCSEIKSPHLVYLWKTDKSRGEEANLEIGPEMISSLRDRTLKDAMGYRGCVFLQGARNCW